MPDLALIGLLSLLFFFVAGTYASVGFGGGSTYTALLITAGLSTAAVPILSLGCNLIVAAGGVWHFTRQGHLSPRLIWPFLISSIPAAWAGGGLHIAPEHFKLLLGVTLLIAGIFLLLPRNPSEKSEPGIRLAPIPAALGIGAGLGILSGIVGIGGGVFLAPVLLLLRWGRPKQVAATCAVFIFLNSIAGLLGQFSKGLPDGLLLTWLPFAAAVFFGGQIGSRLGAGKISQSTVRRITAALILLVGVRLLWISL